VTINYASTIYIWVSLPDGETRRWRMAEGVPIGINSEQISVAAGTHGSWVNREDLVQIGDVWVEAPVPPWPREDVRLYSLYHPSLGHFGPGLRPEWFPGPGQQ
jgi:hypothetical protein